MRSGLRHHAAASATIWVRRCIASSVFPILSSSSAIWISAPIFSGDDAGTDLVGGNDLVALLQLLEKAGKRHRGQIVRRPKVERQSQIDERRKLVPLAAPRAAEAIERLCRALFRIMNERMQRA